MSISDNIELDKPVAMSIITLLSRLNNGNPTEFTKEVMYELIPSYMHAFNNRTHYEEALSFIQRNISFLRDDYLTVIDSRRESLLEKFT